MDLLRDEPMAIASLAAMLFALAAIAFALYVTLRQQHHTRDTDEALGRWTTFLEATRATRGFVVTEPEELTQDDFAIPGADPYWHHVANLVAPMERRLTAVESRLPERRTVDKLESVNDAVLATQIEALTRQVQRLEEQAMTPGRVASTVLAVLGAVAGVVAVSTWALEQIAT